MANKRINWTMTIEVVAAIMPELLLAFLDALFKGIPGISWLRWGQKKQSF